VQQGNNSAVRQCTGSRAASTAILGAPHQQTTPSLFSRTDKLTLASGRCSSSCASKHASSSSSAFPSLRAAGHVGQDDQTSPHGDVGVTQVLHTVTKLWCRPP